MNTKESEYRSGVLMKVVTGRWAIDGRLEITSGEVIEVKVVDNWTTTRIEHNGVEYYAVVPGIKLYEGMPARMRD